MSQPFSDPAAPAPGNYFSDTPPAQAGPPLGRGLVGHVQPVAALLLVVGVLEGVLSLFSIFMTGIAFLIPAEAGTNSTGLAVLFGILAVPTAACSVLRIVAGFYNLRFRRRKLGMIALVGGLATVFTGYCAPTSLALAVYGLIVYLNDSVVAAFQMGDRGRTAAEVQAAFPP